MKIESFLLNMTNNFNEEETVKIILKKNKIILDYSENGGTVNKTVVIKRKKRE